MLLTFSNSDTLIDSHYYDKMKAMNRFLIRTCVLFIPLVLMFSCATTKTDLDESDDKQKSVEVVVEEQEKNQSLEKEPEKASEENVEKEEKEEKKEIKPSKKPKKATSKKQKKVEEKPEEPPAPVIPVFDDWKYMGFGAEVPKEIEETVKAAPVDFIADGFKVYDADTRNTVIFHVAGINVDQAEDKLEASVSNSAATANVPADISLEEYAASESGWVRLNLEYFADKLQVEEEGSENYQSLLKLLDQIYISYQIYRKK